jgi:hypothetical protein
LLLESPKGPLTLLGENLGNRLPGEFFDAGIQINRTSPKLIRKDRGNGRLSGPHGP